MIIPTVSGITPYYNSYTYDGSIVYDSSLYGDNIVYVWPGDLDNNSIVDEEDILPLAASWYEVGNARSHIAMSWTPSATFADADGSGQVDIRDFLAICLNWGSTHSGTFTYGAPSSDFDIDVHRSVLEIIYDEVKNSKSGPQYEIRLYLESLLGMAVPDRFILRQNYPNPFNSSTSIEYQVSDKAHIRLTVWNGLDDGGRDVSSGIYFYSLESPSGDITRKMVLIK